jgi:hypothetical protein
MDVQSCSNITSDQFSNLHHITNSAFPSYQVSKLFVLRMLSLVPRHRVEQLKSPTRSPTLHIFSLRLYCNEPGFSRPYLLSHRPTYQPHNSDRFFPRKAGLYCRNHPRGKSLLLASHNSVVARLQPWKTSTDLHFVGEKNLRQSYFFFCCTAHNI